jgi:hypothetical protein
MGYRWRIWSRYWYKGWWCPRHPWPPPWALTYPEPVLDPSEEYKLLEEEYKRLEDELKEIKNRMDELKKIMEKSEK